MVALPVVLAALLVLDHRPARGASDAGAGATCVRVAAASRYVPYGYNHVVTLTSTCPRDATCTVATDVAPEPQNVAVPRGATVDVVTFMASPAQAFTPRVECVLR